MKALTTFHTWRGRRCVEHKRYSGIGRPRLACAGCWHIWLLTSGQTGYERTEADARALARMVTAQRDEVNHE